MPTIADIRQKYPQYQDLSDDQLADSLHKKFYSDMPREQFNAKIGYRPMGRMEDAARSGASGIVKGMNYLAGTAGDIRDLGAGAVGWAAERLGASPETAGTIKTAAQYVSPLALMPTSKEAFERSNTAGIKLHKPQYKTGEYAETIGEFGAGAVAGPGGALRKGAQMLIPGMASESAGQLARKYVPPAEPYARAAGAFVSGRGTPPRAKGPTSQELIASASDDFGKMGATVKQDAFDRMVTGIGSKAADEGVRPFLEPAAVGVIREMDNQGRWPNTIDDIHKLRQLAGKVAGKSDPLESRAGTLIKREMDKHVDRLRPEDFESANGRASVEALQRGLESYKRGARSKNLQESLEQAKTRAQVWDAGGKDQAIRSELRKITNNPNRLRTYSPLEQALLKKIVGGADAGRVMSSIGRFSPTRVVPAMAGAAVGTHRPLYATIGAVLAGASQVGGYLSTKRKVQELDELFRTGNLPTAQRDRLVRALLAGESGSAPSRGH
jgi:hypothetical protein